MTEPLLPTRTCRYGCGGETARGSFFLLGHDKVAESAVILVECAGVAEFLARRGGDPGGKNARKALEELRKKGTAAP